MLKKSLVLTVSIIVFNISLNAAPWIEPAKSTGKTYKPRPYKSPSFKIKATPHVYRTSFEADGETLAAVLQIKCDGGFNIRINGKLTAFYYPKVKVKDQSHRKSLFTVKEKDGLVEVIFSRGIKPGKNIIAISVPQNGFAASGALIQRDGKTKKINTSSKWQYKQFGPGSYLERDPGLRDLNDTEGWGKVKIDKEKPEVKMVYNSVIPAANAYISKLEEELKHNTKWRLELISDHGILIENWEAFGFGGKERLSEADRLMANKLLEKLANNPNGSKFFEIVDACEALTMAIRLEEEALNLQNTNTAVKQGKKNAIKFANLAKQTKELLLNGKFRDARKKVEGSSENISAAYRKIEKNTANVANRLNESAANRFGWIDVNRMLDNDLGEWGLRVNPLEISWKMSLNGRWRFRIDPKNTGLQDTVHTPAYNIENQWDQITVPGSWESQGFRDANPMTPGDNPFKNIKNRGTDGPYNGYAWYRKTLQVPAEWAGNDLMFTATSIDDYDWVYFNGKEIGHTGGDNHPKDFWEAPRKYKIPKELVNFGGYNVIAIRVYDIRGTSFVGDVELQAPGLQAAYEKIVTKKARKTQIYSSPLSTTVELTVGEKELTMWGWSERGLKGPKSIVFPLETGVTIKTLKKSGVVYDISKDGKLAENWFLLWNDIKHEKSDKPVLSVLLNSPQQISVEQGEKGISVVKITYTEKNSKLLLIRPFRNTISMADSIPQDVLKKCRFWSKAALANPISFTEINKQDAKNKLILNITNIYNYRIYKNDWNINAEPIALLPPFFSYAVEKKYPNCEEPKNLLDLNYSMGKFGKLAGVKGRQISYQVPLDRIPAFGGTTTFAFAGGYDMNARNDLEVKAVETYGGTSWRPQTNLGPDKNLQPCIDAGAKYKVNILHNSSAGMMPGKYDAAIENYGKLAEAFKNLPFRQIAYDPFNEPADCKVKDYTSIVERVIKTIRKYDKKHLIYIESPESYSSVLMLEKIKPINDPLVVYSFHDYAFRLKKYWPNEKMNLKTIYEGFFPAFEFLIERHAPLHLGEFGGFEQHKINNKHSNWVWTRKQAMTEMLDMCKIFQHFHMHFHYYASRGTTKLLPDGSFDQSYVQEAFERFFARGHYNFYLKKNKSKYMDWKY